MPPQGPILNYNWLPSFSIAALLADLPGPAQVHQEPADGDRESGQAV